MRTTQMLHTTIAIALVVCAAISATATATPTGPSSSAVVTAVDWAHLNATTLNALNATDFLTVNAVQLASIPADACAGFTSAQLANTGATAATGQCSDGEPRAPAWPCRAHEQGQMARAATAVARLECATMTPTGCEADRCDRTADI